MLAAFLIALLLCIVLGVYALRVTGERNRLRREIDIWRDSASGFTIVYGPAFANESSRARQLRAERVLLGARHKRKRRK